MGLALCHSLPRDDWARAAAALAAVGCLLQFIALADAGNKARLSWFDVSAGGIDYVATPWEILLARDKGESSRTLLCGKDGGFARATTAGAAACDEYLREMATVVVMTFYDEESGADGIA